MGCFAPALDGFDYLPVAGAWKSLRGCVRRLGERWSFPSAHERWPSFGASSFNHFLVQLEPCHGLHFPTFPQVTCAMILEAVLTPCRPISGAIPLVSVQINQEFMRAGLDFLQVASPSGWLKAGGWAPIALGQGQGPACTEYPLGAKKC